jgi:hypothetical protein
MKALIQKLFGKRIKLQARLPFSKEEFTEIINYNRRTLSEISNWIEVESFNHSCFNYGVPDFIRTKINKPIGEAITYSDIMSLLAKKYFSNINYLELGVSLGKNFYQIINSIESEASFTGFDIEEINPVLESKLAGEYQQSWDTPSFSIKKTLSSFKRFKYKRHSINYLSADIWDENSWSKLYGSKYNLIFSDALHDPKAILFEFEMLIKYNLLDDKFIMLWDDLEGKMKRAFLAILHKYEEKLGIKEAYLIKVNGWVGHNESPHRVGIIGNFAFYI